MQSYAAVLDTYFESLRTRDWRRLATCLAEDVHRSGPYGDVVRGREAYVAFLARVIGSLRGYELRVARVRPLDTASAVVVCLRLAENRVGSKQVHL